MQKPSQNTHPFHLGKYIIFPNDLGKGSYGKVLLAKDQNGTILAAKCIQNKKILTDADDTQRIINEITLYSKLNHRNIVKLKDVLLTQDQTYLILEHCNCENLENFLCKYRELFKHNPTMKVTQILFTQIIEGLYYMFTQKCIHRDVKMANIMLSENTNLNMSINVNPEKIQSYIFQTDIIEEQLNKKLYFDLPQIQPTYWDNEFISDENVFENHLKNYVIKIIDLGFGKQFTNDDELFTASICGNQVGLAPEIWKTFVKELDYYSGDKVDLWSLGVMLYGCVFERFPFKFESWDQLLDLYDNGTYTIPIGNNNPFITVEFLDLINGLLRRDPKDRYGWDIVKNHPFIRKPIEKQKVFKIEESDTLTLNIINCNQQFLSEEELYEYSNNNNVEDNQMERNKEEDKKNVEFRKYLIEIFKDKKHTVVPMETTIKQIDNGWSLVDNKIIESEPQQKEKSFLGKIFSFFSSN